MDNIKVNAVVLRTVDYLENDKILTLLTAERGRITAGIKGVKKAGAKLKFAAQPFCFAEYILAERGGRYTVTQASECESFYSIRTDVNKYYAACAVCETAIALTAEGDPDEEFFSLAVRALVDMSTGDEAFALVTFLLNALKLSGYGITLTEFCANCGASLKDAEKLRFNMERGTFSCFDCGNGAGVSGVTFATLLAAENGQKSVEDGQKSDSGLSGKIRALKLLREYMTYKTDAKCLSLNEYISLLHA